MPLVISIIAFAVFTVLLLVGKLGEASYSFLIAATALFGLVLHGFDRLKELDLKNLRIVLRELQETKKELFVREEKLKSIAIPLAQVVAFTGASEGRIANKESWSAKRKWYKKKLEELILSLDFTPDEEKEAKKFVEKYEEIDKLLADREALKITDADYAEVKKRIEQLSNELVELMRQDFEK
ncbi:MAG: hypothetical protein ABW118_12735 [Candidatus Thiodiazotropha sp.]